MKPAEALPWQRWINLTPLWLGAGMLLYHGLAHPALIYSGVALPLLLFALWRQRTHPARMQWMAGVTLLLAGLWLAALEMARFDAPHILSRAYHYATIEGTATDLEAMGDGRWRAVLRDVTSDDFDAADQQVTLRLKLRVQNGTLNEGERVRLRATLFPPSRPALPGGYDFGRYFALRGIGGVGYSTGMASVIAPAPPTEGMQARITALRHQLQSALLEALPQPQSGIAVALTTGEKTAITADIREAMTDSGLAHMLAISGMHMAIVCGLAYAVLRFGLACIPALALRLPIKQIAAMLGLLCGAAYLTLADFPVSALRAYCMIALVFLAIIVNREADTLRSLVLAALLVLLASPASVTDISFQLSFCATLALIVSYRRLRPWHQRLRESGRPLPLRLAIYFVELALSSLVAGLATAPLTAYHFNQVAPYSIAANMLALPILSALVVPMLLIALLLSPLGWQDAALSVAGWGLEAIAWVARTIANLPQAALHVPSLSALAALVLLAAILSGMAWARRARHVLVCIALCAGALATGYASTPPDLLIAEDRSAVAVRHDAAHWLLLHGSARGFHVEQWQTALGGEFLTLTQAARANIAHDWRCDPAGCEGTLQGLPLRLRKDYKQAEPYCMSDTRIVLATFYARRLPCAADTPPLASIERDGLEVRGSHALWITGEGEASGVRLWNSCAEHRYPAPWSRCNTAQTSQDR